MKANATPYGKSAGPGAPESRQDVYSSKLEIYEMYGNRAGKMTVLSTDPRRLTQMTDQD
jgi:hypothetical protein